MTNDYSLLSILNVLMSWKKPSFFTVVAVGLISAVFSLMQPNYYKAETVFTRLVQHWQTQPSWSLQQCSMYVYGGSDDLDRLFSIVTSERMITYLIRKFDLYKHYDQDSLPGKASLK